MNSQGCQLIVYKGCWCFIIISLRKCIITNWTSLQCSPSYNYMFTFRYKVHTGQYLYPIILATWSHQQKELVKILLDMCDGVWASMDMRFDSSGHSAKFGTYTVIENRINKVISFQLIQVCIRANKNTLLSDWDGVDAWAIVPFNTEIAHWQLKSRY